MLHRRTIQYAMPHTHGVVVSVYKQIIAPCALKMLSPTLNSTVALCIHG